MKYRDHKGDLQESMNTLIEVNRYTETKCFSWGEVKKMLSEEGIELSDNDILEIGYREEDYSHEDAFSPAAYEVRVTRYREETDEEFKRRKEKVARRAIEERQRKKELYLKLKKEFDGESI